MCGGHLGIPLRSLFREIWNAYQCSVSRSHSLVRRGWGIYNAWKASVCQFEIPESTFCSSSIDCMSPFRGDQFLRPLFSNHVCAAFVPHPDFVHALGVNVEPRPGPERLLLVRVRGVARIPDGEGAAQYQVGREAGVGVRRIVGISDGSGAFAGLRLAKAFAPCDEDPCLNIKKESKRAGMENRDQTHGPSVQVKTRLKPQERTCCSASSSDMRVISLARVRRYCRGWFWSKP